MQGRKHMNTAIIGAGFVGRAWAISFARAGHSVRLYDADPGALPVARDFIKSILPDLEANDLLKGQRPDQVLARIEPANDLATALADVDHVQENTPEKVEVKRTVFAELDRLMILVGRKVTNRKDRHAITEPSSTDIGSDRINTSCRDDERSRSAEVCSFEVLEI